MKQDFILHLQELVRFLELVVVKFDHFETYFDLASQYAPYSRVHQITENGYPVSILNSNGKIDSTVSREHLQHLNYYRILGGDDTLLTGEVVVFNPSYVHVEDKFLPLSKLLLEEYPSIRPYYFGVGNKYTQLREQYPNDFELIKRIFYPIDVPSAISASNMDILYAPSMFLRDNERDDILEHLQELLRILEYRWYINTFESEDLYPLTFWATIWGYMPILLLLRRIDNLHTDKAHSFFVWEYLQSKGLPNLSTIVTQNQEHYLYKNIRYLQQNFGKHFLLKELEEVFLKPRRCHFIGKRLLNITDNREQYSDRLPVVIDTINKTPKYSDSNNIESFLNSVVTNGYADIRDSQADVIEDISFSRRSEYQTKFVEIRSSSNSDDTRLIFSMIVDSFMRLYSQGKIEYNILINNPKFGTEIETISIHDCLCLINYLINYDKKDTVTIPNLYVGSNAIGRRDRGYPKEIGINSFQYLTDFVVDINRVYDSLPAEPPDHITSPVQVAEYITGEVNWMLQQRRHLRKEHSGIEYRCLLEVLRYIVPSNVDLPLPTEYDSYSTFFSNKDDLRVLIENLSGAEDREELLDALFSTMLPIKYTEAIDTTTIIEAITTIFKSLTSYNITMLSSMLAEQLTINNHTLGGVQIQNEESWIGLTDYVYYDHKSVTLTESCEKTVYLPEGMDVDTINEVDESSLELTFAGAESTSVHEEDSRSIYAYNYGTSLQLLDDLI